MKCHNLLSFKEREILLCKSISEAKQISHIIYGSAPFTILLNLNFYPKVIYMKIFFNWNSCHARLNIHYKA